MTITTFDCEQGSDAWKLCRVGKVTASEMHNVIANGKGGAPSKTRRDYMDRLAAEIVSGDSVETYTNAHMERGKEMEDEARKYYAFLRDAEPQHVGFVYNDAIGVGCSPDALIEPNGLLEIKTKLPKLIVKCIRGEDFPPEHKAQCQTALWVTEREWLDLLVYYRKMPAFLVRCVRDENYIRELAVAVRSFRAELAETVEQVRAHKTR